VRSVQLVARPNHTQNVISPFRAFTISFVACNLLHDQTTHGTLFNLSCIHDFFRSMQLVARPNHAQNVISPFRAFTISCVACNLLHEQTTHGALFNLSGIHDFVRSVYLDTRPNHAQSLIYPFRTFMISCNKLHATIDMVQDNLSTKEHINRTFYVRITLSLIYRNSKNVYA